MFNKRILFVLLLTVLITILFAVTGYAETKTITVMDETHTIDTGDGSDGNIRLQLKPGDSTKAELLVNGVVKTTITADAVIKKHILEKGGEALTDRSDVTVKVFNIEDIVKYLPINNLYAPKNDNSGSSTVVIKRKNTGAINTAISAAYGLTGVDTSANEAIPGVTENKESTRLRINSGATANGNITVTLNGTPHYIPVDITDITYSMVCQKINNYINNNTGGAYTSTTYSRYVYITANTAGPQQDTQFDAGTTGVNGSVNYINPQGAAGEYETNTITVTSECSTDGTIGISFSDGTINKTINVNVTAGDSTASVAGKIKTALEADTSISGAYNITTSYSIPNFKNLTIASGVMLRSKGLPLNFRVQEKLTVEGYLSSAHGLGGKAATYSTPAGKGGTGKNILVYAKEVTVNINAVIFGGFGGGGGGGYYNSDGSTNPYGRRGGTGGDGADITIYTIEKFTNNGEIHAGAGGGGGTGYYSGSWINGGQPGFGGDINIITENLENSGKVLSGLGGGKAKDADDDHGGYPGYGGGGINGYDGAAGGEPAGTVNWNGTVNVYSDTGFGGTEGIMDFCRYTYKQTQYGYWQADTCIMTHGNIKIAVNGSYSNTGKFGIGYSNPFKPGERLDESDTTYTFYGVDSKYPNKIEVKTSSNVEIDIFRTIYNFGGAVKYIFNNGNVILKDKVLKGPYSYSIIGKTMNVEDTFYVEGATQTYNAPAGYYTCIKGFLGDKNITENITFSGSHIKEQTGITWYGSSSNSNSYILYVRAKDLVRIKKAFTKITGSTYYPSPSIKINSLNVTGFQPTLTTALDSNGVVQINVSSYNKYAGTGTGNYFNFKLVRNPNKLQEESWEDVSGEITKALITGVEPIINDIYDSVAGTEYSYSVQFKPKDDPAYIIYEDDIAKGTPSKTSGDISGGLISSTPVPAITMKANGYMIISNRVDSIQIIDPSGNIQGTPQKWEHTGLKILALVTRPDDSIILAGQKGAYQIRKPDGTLGTKGMWEHANIDIIAIEVVPNGNVLMMGKSGYYQLLKITKTGSDYQLDLGGKGQLVGVGEVISTLPRPDGRILIASNRGYNYYKLDNEYDISVAQNIGSSTVTLNTTWEGKGFEGAKLLVTPEGGSTTEKDFSGTTVAASGLEAGRKYTFRVKAPMAYPVYFLSKPVMVTVAMPVAITNFTDRITAANKWIQEYVDSGATSDERSLREQEVRKKGYNKYFPDSEVVCKFVIDPKNMDIDKYHVNLDINADNTSNVDIEYVKIVRIDYNGVPRWGYTDNPGAPGGADKPLCGYYDGTKTISFDIDNPDKNVVTVYCKYKFINPRDLTILPYEFRNRVEVTATSGGSSKTLEPMYNTIQLRKSKIIYM